LLAITLFVDLKINTFELPRYQLNGLATAIGNHDGRDLFGAYTGLQIRDWMVKETFRYECFIYRLTIDCHTVEEREGDDVVSKSYIDAFVP